MRNMLLNNGQTVIVGSDRDVLEVIGENFSYELAEYIDQILWNQEALDKYMRDIEKEKDILKNTIREYLEKYAERLNTSMFDAIDSGKELDFKNLIRELQNDEYFEYLLNRR